MTKLKQLQPLLLRGSRHGYLHHRYLSNGSENKGDSKTADADSSSSEKPDKKLARPMFVPEIPLCLEELEEPTNCCMSGCANCVWIEYAEKLSSVLKGSQSEVQKLIMDKVQDPNMRAFLSMELRIRKLIN